MFLIKDKIDLNNLQKLLLFLYKIEVLKLKIRVRNDLLVSTI